MPPNNTPLIPHLNILYRYYREGGDIRISLVAVGRLRPRTDSCGSNTNPKVHPIGRSSAQVVDELMVLLRAQRADLCMI